MIDGHAVLWRSPQLWKLMFMLPYMVPDILPIPSCVVWVCAAQVLQVRLVRNSVSFVMLVVTVVLSIHLLDLQGERQTQTVLKAAFGSENEV